MFKKLKSIYRRIPSFSPRFHIAFGLSSLLTAVVLLSMFLGFVPDRDGALLSGRVAVAEAVSSTNSLLLKRGDLSGIRGALDFIVERNTDLNAVELHRSSDNSRAYFGFEKDSDDQAKYVNDALDGEDSATTLVGGSIVTVPLLRGNSQWGLMHFQFGVAKSISWLDRLRQGPFSLMAFIGLISLPMFYFYLGKMLKELNPSAAVPGRVRSALDTIAESLLVIDSRRNVVLANAAFADLNGKPAEDLLGIAADTLSWIQVDEESPSYPWEQAYETGQPTRMDMVGYTDKEGEARKFIVNCSPVMGAKGKVGGVLISMDDVTLLEEKELLLRQSMEEAEAANEAKTAFLSNMSHEIRTPMTAILGFTEVLKRGLDPAEVDRQRHLNTILNSGTHLLELINDVLDLSKVESGAMEVERIECKAAYIANEVAHVLKVKAREKEIDLKVVVENELPAHIISDPSRLRQIITNLVGNAIKFTEEGGVTIALEYKDDDTDPRMLIKVSDSGIGMNEKQLASIFEAFVQADASITRRFGGTGLGLSISRQLALAMEGDIIVTSELGKGSTFMLTVPVGDISDVPMLSVEDVFKSFSEVEINAAKDWTFPACRALVVDDGPENRELLTVVLEELGITIETGENGKEGLDSALSKEYDIILMDIQMPVMDGYEAVAAMRKSGIELPIVALTANAMKGYEQRVLEAGFSHYMTKPIDLDHLTNLLAELLNGTYTLRDESTVATPSPQAARLSAETQTAVSPAITSQATPSAATPTAEKTQATPIEANNQATVALDGAIYSSMAELNPKFETIARQFVVRLADQIAQMQEALDKNDYDALAKLAHWLKGSGGTVGFKEFSEPARELEIAGKASNYDESASNLENIIELHKRIRFKSDEAVGLNSGSVHQSVETLQTEKIDTVNTEPNTQKVDKDITVSITPVFSSLPLTNEKFRSIVEQFIPKLNGRMVEFENAVESHDFESLIELGHWLKGSGGNVGFSGFTALADAIEISAKAQDIEQIAVDFRAIEKFTEQVNHGWESQLLLDKSA